MAATVELRDWNRIIRLPYLVLFSFRWEQGKLYEKQLNHFVRQLAELAQTQWSSVQGQLLDDALKEGTAVIRELEALNPSAVVTETRRAIHTAGVALDESTFQAYLAAMLTLHGSIERSLPLRGRLMGFLARHHRNRVFDSSRALLEEAIDARTQLTQPSLL
jgi:hypothetical protein